MIVYGYKQKLERGKPYMTTEERFEFARNLPVEELFNHIREITGIKDLVFEYEVRKNYREEPYPQFHSQDLADRVGFLDLMFKHIYIKQFNSEVAFDSENNRLYYWGTVAFSYEHHPCGSNGSTFMTVWYDRVNGWTYRLDKYRG